jgi:hypothetical protein
MNVVCPGNVLQISHNPVKRARATLQGSACVMNLSRPVKGHLEEANRVLGLQLVGNLGG